MILSLCVHGPLPDPWLSWAVCWTSCMHEDPDLATPTLLDNDSAVNMNGYLTFPLLSLWPVLFFLPQEEQVHRCHHVSVYKYKLLTCMVKLVSLLLCCSTVVISQWCGVQYACYYKVWVQTCCGLTVAYTCTKLWPCYWSQTTLVLAC